MAFDPPDQTLSAAAAAVPAEPADLTEPPPGRRRPILAFIGRSLVLLLVLGTVGGIIWWALGGAQKAGGPPGGPGGLRGDRPQTVDVATITSADLPIVQDALGTVTSLATVTVRPRIPGQITRLAFTEGQTVAEGDLLLEIDARPYTLALAQAEAQLARDQAQLDSAKRDLERYRMLARQDSIASQQRDQQESTVLQLQGTVLSDQAAVGTAKLNLVYCRITAPVAGRVGLRQIDRGNYVQTSDTNGLVVITQVKPISVVFTVPEDALPPILQRLHSGASLAVTAFDRSGTKVLAQGTLATIDNQIDTSTGTVKLRASFDNQDEALFPNQFVNVRLTVDTLKAVPVVPQAAVLRGSPGTFVYRVNPESQTVSVRPVRLGAREGGRVVVESGLAVGDVVVTDGTDRLREGAKVKLPEPRPAGAEGAAAGEAPAAGAPQREHRQHRSPDGQGKPAAGEAKP